MIMRSPLKFKSQRGDKFRESGPSLKESFLVSLTRQQYFIDRQWFSFSSTDCTFGDRLMLWLLILFDEVRGLNSELFV